MPISVVYRARSLSCFAVTGCNYVMTTAFLCLLPHGCVGSVEVALLRLSSVMLQSRTQPTSSKWLPSFGRWLGKLCPGSTASQRSTIMASHSGPIVSCVGAPSYQLSKHITSLISPPDRQDSFTCEELQAVCTSDGRPEN